MKGVEKAVGAPADAAVFVHSACALWLPEAGFSQPERMAGVVLDGLSKDRLELPCTICKQNGGAVM